MSHRQSSGTLSKYNKNKNRRNSNKVNTPREPLGIDVSTLRCTTSTLCEVWSLGSQHLRTSCQGVYFVLTLSHAFLIYAVIPTVVSKQPIHFPCTIALHFKIILNYEEYPRSSLLLIPELGIHCLLVNKN
jgi:hypothetical protein